MDDNYEKITIKDKRNCCGCGLCSTVCPKNAIVMKADVEGFYYPAINNALCVNCGKCVKICIMWESED